MGCKAWQVAEVEQGVCGQVLGSNPSSSASSGAEVSTNEEKELRSVWGEAGYVLRWIQRAQTQSMPRLPLSAQHQQLKSGTDSLTVRKKGDRNDSSVLKHKMLLFGGQKAFLAQAAICGSLWGPNGRDY